MSANGWLPPGVTDHDIDRAAPGYYDDPFYCELADLNYMHCFNWSGKQCPRCQRIEAETEPHNEPE